MTEIRFYHLMRSQPEQALPELLEKTLAKGWRAVVKTAASAQVEALNAHLWTYRKDSFLPHGAAKDNHAQEQPIWLTDKDEAPNEAQAAFVLDGSVPAAPESFALVCDMFDGNDNESVERARTRWTAYKTAGHKMAYWQQVEKGWTQKGE